MSLNIEQYLERLPTDFVSAVFGLASDRTAATGIHGRLNRLNRHKYTDAAVRTKKRAGDFRNS